MSVIVGTVPTATPRAEPNASKLLDAAASKQYRDSPALAAVKLLEEAGMLQG